MVKLTFLGGADEVGASCTLLEMAGRRLLVDCGIRMTSNNGDILPWLDPIQEGGGIDAIILTHAHMDHLGAMPLIHQSYPHVPLYMTASTLSLATILLMDSLKIMQSELEKEGEVPLYPIHAVEMLLGASRPVPFGQKIDILDGDIQLTYTPAGHILGAAAVYVESDDGRVLMSGDISVTDQKTIPGMMIPPIRPDLVVAESTYGGRLHANRAAEEHRLIQQVKEVIERRGSVLFPAFAVGRAQEIILILSQAMEQKKLPSAPIFVDGMIRSVCQAYASYPDLLTPWLRKRVQKHGNPFFFTGGPAQPVTDPRTRQAVAKTRPAIIVSSSGMLSGGPSPIYARQLLDDPANHIAITGYQDEESPGRQIQEVARAGGGRLRIGGEEVTLHCTVGTYGLSAHADTGQIVSAMAGFQPKEIALVHGDGGARQALKQALLHANMEIVHLPCIGQSIELQGTTRSRPKKQPNNAKALKKLPLQKTDLDDLAGLLHAQKTAGRLYTIQELLCAWGDHEGATQPLELKRVAALLEAPGGPFSKDKKRPFLFKLRNNPTHPTLATKKPPTTPTKKSADANGIMDANSALQRVDTYLSEKDGLYKRSTHKDKTTIALSFYFPKIAEQQHAELFEKLQTETGWNIEIRQSVHQEALAQAVTEEMPPEWNPTKRPSLHLLEEKVTLQLETPPTPESFAACHQALLEKTGFSLEIKGFSLPTASNEPTNTPQPQRAEDSTQTSTDQHTPQSFQAEIPDGESSEPMEINQTYAAVKRAFKDAPHELLKVGRKGENLEVTFISPQIGALYQESLEQLTRYTGWPIEIRSKADQHRIKELAKQLLPKEWGLNKEPGFFADKAQILATLKVHPPAEQAREIRKKFLEETGFTLEFKL